MTELRQIKEGNIPQGVSEEAIYTLDVSAWGNDPTSVSVDVFPWANNAKEATVKSTVMPTGSPTVSGNVITLPTLKSLTDGVTYRVEVTFTVSSNKLIAYFLVKAEL
jgi:hypothetical protein